MPVSTDNEIYFALNSSVEKFVVGGVGDNDNKFLFGRHKFGMLQKILGDSHNLDWRDFEFRTINLTMSS